MAGRQDTQQECGSKTSPGNHLLHPTQLRAAMATQGEVEKEAAKKRARKKGRRKREEEQVNTVPITERI
ncbi:hypothetical protein E2C01_035237 [Portunus trituberculatus]|uniref:Uncharacterized protein n=1 Tax=Portunus trituberculatus TaxID=210409 RepID=A0A5B7F7T5_PORTR|nr:hypothetical protein [Portunus trituberculatus]